MPDLYALDEPRRAASGGRRFPVLALIAIVFVGFILYQVGATISESHADLELLALAPGERIEYDYTARFLDGGLLETTIYQVAQRANRTEGFPLRTPAEYQPARAVLDPDQPGLGFGSELEQAVLASHVGATVRVLVEPDAAFGAWAPLFPGQPGVPKHLDPPQPFFPIIFMQEPAAAEAEGNRPTPGFDMDQLDAAIGPLEPGLVFNAEIVFPPTWDIVFEAVNWDNRSVLVRHAVEDGDFLPVAGLPGGVTVLIDESRSELTYRVDLETGVVFTIPPNSPLVNAGFTAGSYRVVDQDETLMQIEYHPSQDALLIEQALQVEIRILSRPTS